MAALTISLLGTIQVTTNERPVTSGAYAKALALLAYLAVESDRPHTRSALATMFWPDQPEENARHSLRQALSTIRRILDSPLVNDEYLLASRETLQFNRESDYDLDVRRVVDLMAACRQHDHRQLETCPACSQRLQAVVPAYRGDFLQGFAIEDSYDFEDWVQVWRQRLLREAIDACTALVSWHEHRGALDAATESAIRLLQLDPWQEPAHRHLMDLLWRQGKRAEAMAQYERCRKVLDDELGVPPDQETTALYEHIASSANGGRWAPHRAIRTRQAHQLPSPPGRLVGRERDMEAIADLLAQRDCRLLTLTGPGGIGKTRLAIEVAREHARHSAEGTYFISLAALRNSADIVPAIAAGLELTLLGETEPVLQVREWLRERSVFLVLDNVEHVIDGIDVVADLLEAAPETTILATTRQRLDLRGEWIYEVGGLDVPATDDTDSAEGYGAIELFGERLRQVRPRTPMRHEERTIVTQICHLVDGMPLAIELAAAWAQSLTLAQIAGEVQKNLDFLATSMRDIPDRHRSMRAVFNQTWSMMRDEERVAYRMLSAFQDGFRLEAAEEVAGTTPQHLAALAAKSLVHQQANGRYRLHGLLRQYGSELVAHDAAERTALHDRHCDTYLTFLAAEETALIGEDQQAALDRIEEEIGNIRAAWGWAVEHRKISLIAASGQALWLFYVIRGWMREGAMAFGNVLAALTETACDGQDAGATLARANALVRTGGFRSGLGEYDAGLALMTEGIATIRELGARRDLGLALNMLAAAHVMKGDLDASRSALVESLEHFRHVGDAWGIAYSLNDLGLTAHLAGEDAAAERYCDESRSMLRTIGDRRGRAFAAYNLGMIASGVGNHQGARRLYRESLALRQDSHDQWGMAASLVQLGETARTLGATQEARTLLAKALRIAWNSSVTPVVLDALVGLAAVQIDEGQGSQAAPILEAATRHPAVPGHLRARIVTLREAIGDGNGADPELDDREAVRAVDDLARQMVG